jgi:hypothetical protein
VRNFGLICKSYNDLRLAREEVGDRVEKLPKLTERKRIKVRRATLRQSPALHFVTELSAVMSDYSRSGSFWHANQTRRVRSCGLGLVPVKSAIRESDARRLK